MKKLFLLIFLLLAISSNILSGCAENKENKEVLAQKAKIDQEALIQKQREEKRVAYQDNLRLELEQVIKGLSNNGTIYSVFVYLPDSDVDYSYNNKKMGSASMIKVFILEKAYSEIANGTINEEMTLPIERDTKVGGAGSLQGYGIGTPIKMSTLLRKMIIESDNTATNMLIKYLGMDNINKYMQEKGYTESLLCRRMMDFESLRAGRDNVTSVKDLGLFYKRIYSGTAVTPELDKKMISILKEQEDTNKIPFYLPQGIEVAHKTGEINAVMNDGGIVFAKRPYVLCILTDKAPGYNLAIRQVAELSKKVYDVLQQLPALEENKSTEPTEKQNSTKESASMVEEPKIVDKPVLASEYKQKLMREYSLKHYGEEMTTIIPQAVVVHWTAAPTMDSAWNWFYKEEYGNAPGTLNVGSQFIVDRDGTIYRLMPENTLARHAIGYNHCAIGIENVGGTNGKEDLTQEQLKANIELITYLKGKYPTINYVWGHYQQDKAKASGLYKEKISGYYSGKPDPGPIFMGQLQNALETKNLKFFEK